MRRRITGSGGVVPIAPFAYLGEEGTPLPENVIAAANVAGHKQTQLSRGAMRVKGGKT